MLGNILNSMLTVIAQTLSFDSAADQHVNVQELLLDQITAFED